MWAASWVVEGSRNHGIDFCAWDEGRWLADTQYNWWPRPAKDPWRFRLDGPHPGF